MPFVGIEAFDPKRIIYFLSREQELKTDEWCMFKFLGEWEIGKIKFCVEKEHPGEETKIRKATLADLEEFEKRKVIAKKAKEFAIEKIKEYELSMKLTSTKYPLTKKKIIFYYTAKERVDFRKLVKELAKEFKLRVQMQQIGVRDEPQILGGIGICGREVCCACFLGKHKNKLPSVTLEAARLQNLPLISSKISGICGRLRCCLNFEHSVYSTLIKEFPRIGKEIKVGEEKVKVIGCNLLIRTITIETPAGLRKTITEDQWGKK